MATRDLTSGIVNSLDDEVLKPFFAVELLFDGAEVLRLWTGYGTLTYQGNTWFGSGEMLSVESVEESTEISAKGASISLSGIPQDVLSLALTEPYQGRKAKIYFGLFLDSDVDFEDYALNGLVPFFVHDPINNTYLEGSEDNLGLSEIFSGYMDQMNIEEGPDSCTVQLTLENKLVDLERARVARFTSAYQKSVYSGDLGLDFVEDLQDKEIVWGRSSGS